MVLADTLDSMHLYIYCLARTELRKHDVGVCRCRRVSCEHLCLLASGFPHQMGGNQFVVDVQLIRICAVFGCLFVALALEFEGEDDGVAVS